MINPESKSEKRRVTQSEKTEGKHRFNLVLPKSFFNTVRELAEKRDTSVTELIKQSLRLRLELEEIAEDAPGGAKQLDCTINGRDYRLWIL